MSKLAIPITVISFVALMTFVTSAADSDAAGVKVDPRFPDFVPDEERELQGLVRPMGSDTLFWATTLWAEKFRSYYPNVRFRMARGNSTAPGAFLEDLTKIGPMSRLMTERELEKLRQKYGYEPTPIRVAVDVLGVFVHRDNPIAKRGLTFAQLDAIFSCTRMGGHPKDIKTWGDLGLDGQWKNQPISLYGRNSASGAYSFFKIRALQRGNYKEDVQEQPGSSAVVAGVAKDRYGIGYSGVAYRTAGVALVPLALDQESKPVDPLSDYEAYPLRRYLYVYHHLKPGTHVSPPIRELARLIYSRQGQEIVIKAGYLPISADVAVEDGKKIGIEIELFVKDRPPHAKYELVRVLEVAGRQGIATDGQRYFVSGSKALFVYSKQGELLKSNEDPFAELEKPANHFGDISEHDGELYTGIEWFEDGRGKDIQIAVYDAATLKFKRSFPWNPESGQVEVSALAVDVPNGLVWITDWVNGNYVYRYKLTDGRYAGKLHLRPVPQWQQGIAYYAGHLYITADDGDADSEEADNLWRVPADPRGTAAYVRHELAFDQLRDLGEIEGIDFDEAAGEMLVLSNRGKRIVLGMPKGFYPGYDREISEVYVFRMTKS